MVRSLDACFSSAFVVVGSGFDGSRSCDKRSVTLLMAGWIIFLLSLNQSGSDFGSMVAVDVAAVRTVEKKVGYCGLLGSSIWLMDC